MILFLDYDGVLHPDAVYLRLNGDIELRAPGKLFIRFARETSAFMPGRIARRPQGAPVLASPWVKAILA